MKKIILTLVISATFLVLSQSSAAASSQCKACWNTMTGQCDMQTTPACDAGSTCPINVSDPNSCSGANANCSLGGSGLVMSCILPQAACGPASGGSYSTAPSGASLCATGNASVVSGSGPWSWTCGSATLSAVACSANLLVATHGACGSDNGQHLTSPPTNLCGSGVNSTVIDNATNWSWNCTASDGVPVSCQTFKPAVPTNGICGTDNGGTFSSAPSVHLCTSSSTIPTVTNPAGAWIWSCGGWNGGNSVSCSANVAAAGAVCGNNICEGAEACETTAGGTFISCPGRTTLPAGKSCVSSGGTCVIVTGAAPPPPTGSNQNYDINAVPIGFKYGNISDILTFAIKLIISLCGFAFIIMLLYGSFKYVTSQGDKMAITEAWATISHAVIGLALAAGLFAILTLLQNIFGISLVNITI